jgi:TDG/mug DNA glycosylase family protein
MSAEQINIRLKPDLVAALDRVAREESLDRATAIRRLLGDSIRRWELERAVRGYQTGEVSLGRAAEEAGITQWELLEAVEAAGIAHPLTATEAEDRLAELLAEPESSLPDIPPREGGVLLVGINPAPVSVAAGHYYQGRIGQRLWRRLERIGLLRDAVPGREDEAFARAGHGLTDLVKRPTASSSELSEAELNAGVDTLRRNIRGWRPRLVLFAFKEPARRVGGPVTPGPGATVEGVPTFLLSGPYAPREEAARIDAELIRVLGGGPADAGATGDRSETVTARDLEAGRIRVPRSSKRFFPSTRATVEVVLRGTRLECRYDPRTGPDRERSAVLSVRKAVLADLVAQGDVLEVTRSLGGIVRLD